MSLAEIIAARRDRRRELRAELAPLEQDAATDEMQRIAYLEALGRERQGAEVALARARAMPTDRREWLAWEPRDAEPPTWGKRAAAAERRLASVDAEIERARR